MTCITGADNVEYCDGRFTGFCPSEKQQAGFEGLVALTETNRVIARGVCACRTPLEVVLYTP